MATNKNLAGPAFIPSGVSNIIAAPAATLVNTLRHIHVANRTNATAKFRLWLGATGASTAGTDLFFDKPVSAYDVYDHYLQLTQKSTDYLTGQASVASALVITITGDQEVVP